MLFLVTALLQRAKITGFYTQIRNKSTPIGVEMALIRVLEKNEIMTKNG